MDWFWKIFGWTNWRIWQIKTDKGTDIALVQDDSVPKGAIRFMGSVWRKADAS